MIAVTCLVCGEKKLIQVARRDTFRTCSRACAAEWNSSGSKVVRECRGCGKRDAVRPQAAAHPFCSARCYWETLRVGESPRDPEERRLSHSRAKVKRAWRKAGFGGEPGYVSKTEWATVISAHDGRCAYCGEPPQRLTIDHVVPASRGGDHFAGNVVPACFTCNQSKKDRIVSPRFGPHAADHEAISEELR